MEPLNEDKANTIALRAVDNFFKELSPLTKKFPHVHAKAVISIAHVARFSYGEEKLKTFLPDHLKENAEEE